jgi:hypothetical protein
MLSGCKGLKLQVVDIEHPNERIAEQERVFTVVKAPRHFLKVAGISMARLKPCPSQHTGDLTARLYRLLTISEQQVPRGPKPTRNDTT